MSRQQRRAEARRQLKLASRTSLPAEPAVAPSAAPLISIPEPGIPFPSLASLTPKPISNAQLAANRANSQLSTGPVTPAGLAASSQNRTTHGLARHNGAFKLLPTEDPNGFEALRASLIENHKPTDATESILINEMAESHWLANRAQNLQAGCFDPETGQISDPKMFSLYLRYQTTHSRAFHKSLNDLLKVRAESRKTQNGFEAQKRKQEELRIKNERHEMKKQTHYWEVLRKDGEACHKLASVTIQQMDAAKANPGFEAQYGAELAKRGAQQHQSRVATAS